MRHRGVPGNPFLGVRLVCGLPQAAATQRPTVNILYCRVECVRHKQGKITPAGSASWRQMSKSPSRRFPVTVTQLPVTRCQICHRTVAYRPGNLSEVLTGHYRRAHPEALGLPSQAGTRLTATSGPVMPYRLESAGNRLHQHVASR